GSGGGGMSPALIRFNYNREALADSLLREWKTLYLTSALLAFFLIDAGILMSFQAPEMSDDPLTITTALLSLICSTMSLSYRCVFIVRLRAMRSMGKASRWAEVRV
ncbi:hypothetical protein BDQ17DRAFT_1250474, partial [Cyathus striatus]